MSLPLFILMDMLAIKHHIPLIGLSLEQDTKFPQIHNTFHTELSHSNGISMTTFYVGRQHASQDISGQFPKKNNRQEQGAPRNFPWIF